MTGSSPLVRGALVVEDEEVDGAGIIPARAGSTKPVCHVLPDLRDHPRSCGEHRLTRFRQLKLLGSSPLVRGAQAYDVPFSVSDGIIPARAGSTRSSCPPACACRDHPRSCGEHWMEDQGRSRSSGSSPLVRGAPGADPRRDVVDGIIPARAGSTSSAVSTANAAKDHPRSCGEHLDCHDYHSFFVGSSPLVRGAPTALISSELSAGIIPARAGSTACNICLPWQT